jgi:hypothetical protein
MKLARQAIAWVVRACEVNMTRFPGIAIGLAAFLAAGSASAATIYDTISGYTSTGAFKLGAVTPPGNNLTHDPMGDEFTVSPGTTPITSVTVGLADSLASGSTNDGGSVLVYLVGDTSGLPASTGLALSAPTLIGTISDGSLVSGGGITKVTLAPASPLALAPGNYWLELTSGADPNNGGTNSHQTTAAWGYFATSSLIGPTVGSISSFVIGSTPPFQTSNGPNLDAGFQNVFEAQVNTPEPGGLALLGAGIAALGFARRRRATISTG